jgi:hypothetical protein
MKCGNWKCEGELTINCVHTKTEHHIEAHKIPVFLQCNTCNYAPDLDQQPDLVKQFLEEFITTNCDMEAIQRSKQPKIRSDDHKIRKRSANWAEQENLVKNRKRRGRRNKPPISTEETPLAGA